MTWWAASVTTGKEYELKRELADAGINVDNILIPRREVVEVKKNKVTIKGEKMFPGYLIIEADSLPDLKKSEFHAAILGIVTEAEMVIIREQEKSVDRDSSTAEIGEKIIVTSGPFLGVKGYINQINIVKHEVVCRLVFQGQDIEAIMNMNFIDRIK